MRSNPASPAARQADSPVPIPSRLEKSGREKAWPQKMVFPLIKLLRQGGQIGFVELVKFFYVGTAVVVFFCESLLGLGEVAAGLGGVAFLGVGFGEPVHEVGVVAFEGEAGLEELDSGGGLAHFEVGDAAEEEGLGSDVFETGDARFVLDVLVEVADEFIEKNEKLVIIPFPGIRDFDLRPDQVNQHEKAKLLDKLGIKYLRRKVKSFA